MAKEIFRIEFNMIFELISLKPRISYASEYIISGLWSVVRIVIGMGATINLSV
jgi:hypothetical protein